MFRAVLNSDLSVKPSDMLAPTLQTDSVRRFNLRTALCVAFGRPIEKREMMDCAEQVLRDNDRGIHAVPTHGLYPIQLN